MKQNQYGFPFVYFSNSLLFKFFFVHFLYNRIKQTEFFALGIDLEVWIAEQLSKALVLENLSRSDLKRQYTMMHAMVLPQ